MRPGAALLLCVFAVSSARAVELQPQTVEAFEKYIRETEARLNRRLENSFLWSNEEPRRASLVRAGQLALENRNAGALSVPGGLIHDWMGSVFIPGATLAKTLALMQDYDRNQDHYKPEVMNSRLISRDGNNFKVRLRLMKKEVITVILDTDYDVLYVPVDNTRCRSRAYSTRIVEVANAGKPEERSLPPGRDNGFLWRLNSYWSFEERDGGVFVECEAISLSRSIPAGLGWLIEPIIRNLPRQSLDKTLRATREALRAGP